MHFSPYHKKPTWQKFLAGMFFGAVVAYTVFTFMYGKMYESLLAKNIQLHADIATLTKQYDALIEQKEKLEQTMPYTIGSTEVHFTNEKQFQQDALIQHQLTNMIKKELETFIGKPVQSVAENDTLLIKLIENNVYTIDDLTFELQVKKLFIYEKLTLFIQLKKVN